MKKGKELESCVLKRGKLNWKMRDGIYENEGTLTCRDNIEYRKESRSEKYICTIISILTRRNINGENTSKEEISFIKLSRPNAFAI